MTPRYAALDVTSNFSFLEGGSHPEELVATAKALGLEAIAIADRNTLAGVARGHLAAREIGMRFIVGARLDLQDAPSLLAYPTDRAAYGRLCRLLTLGQRRAEKGDCLLYLEDVTELAEGLIFIALPPDDLAFSDVSDTAESPAPQSAEILSFPGNTDLPLPSVERVGVRGDLPIDSSSPSPGAYRADLSPTGRGKDALPVEPGDDTTSESDFPTQLRRLKATLPAPLYLAARHTYAGDDRARIEALARLGQTCGTPIVASTGALYHASHRRPLQDVLTCVREKCTISEAGFHLRANAERHLKTPQEIARLFKGHEDALARSIEIADRCRFSLDELKYEYPDEPVPKGKTPQSHLEYLTWEGAAWRFPEGVPDRIQTMLEKELALIDQLSYAPYFLTVHDIVHFARSRAILCQGRGSAANSVVCYCLAITNVNPAEIDLLFERFISPERNEPPDIDVDFEHERREEVIQYIYGRYGRERAGLAATVISYRGRSAIREVGKAMGLSEDTVAALSGTVWGLSNRGLPDEYVRQAGLDPQDPLLARTLELTQELTGFPRHLSQHVGGFVLTRGPLCETVPIGNGAMADRTFIEWDKDDLDALGLMKVDVLALGMLTCIRKCLAMLKTHYGRDLTLATVPRDDPATYDMLCKADSLGVFQVESRAQMNMLPRLKPRCFYDLVIEVAIVRPGPIQGDMVHPYLRRRSGDERVEFPSPAPKHGPPDELHQVLGKTMGVPLFQEQAMRLAMVAAKFSSEEANELRRAMATFRRRGTIGKLEHKMVSRMSARGYPRDFAERCFNQIKGFGEYGFPESHAASFAHLVYVSSWLKCHYPAAFAAALPNSQPMGFYAPAQIVRCAREHGVEAREADINHSLWDCTLEPASENGFALRLGLRQIDGFKEDDARNLVAKRENRPPETEPHLFAPPASLGLPPPPMGAVIPSPGKGEGGDGRRPAPGGGHVATSESDTDPLPNPPPSRGRESYTDLHDLWRRSGLSRTTLERLAGADAMRSLGLDRRQALWAVRGLPERPALPLFDYARSAEMGEEPQAALPEMPLPEHVVNDYRSLRLSLKAHPMQFLREYFAKRHIVPCGDLREARDGMRIQTAGVVLVRQRPGSAQGVVFMTIEDETGVANAVVWPKTFEKFRREVMGSRLIVIQGRIQRHEDIVHLVSARLEDRSDLLGLLSEGGLEANDLLANADEVRRPDPGSWRGAKLEKRKEETAFDLPVAHGDHVKHGGEDARARAKERTEEKHDRYSRAHPRWRPKHPRSERIIPKSRDFH